MCYPFLATRLSREPEKKGIYCLFHCEISDERIVEEILNFRALFLDSILSRVSIASFDEVNTLRRFKGAIDPRIENLFHSLEGKIESFKKESRVDYDFVVKKILILKSLVHPEFISRDELHRLAGCSLLSVDSAVDSLGSLIERDKSRKMRLKYVSDDLLTQLVVKGQKARSTTRFRYSLGGDAPKVEWIDQIKNEKLNNVMIGGSLGTAHYFENLDIAGIPRVDLSIRCHNSIFDLSFLSKLVPGLKKVDDPQMPADLVVHAVRHKDPFPAISGKEFIADEVECLLDLLEMNFKKEGEEFKSFLSNKVAQEFKRNLESNSKVFRSIIDYSEGNQ